MKTLLLFLAALFPLWPLMAQPLQISGTVRTAGGDPLARAHVFVSKTTGTVTDEDGSFRLNCWRKSDHVEVVVSYLGYETALRVLDAAALKAGQARLDFVLQPKSALLEEVTIQAERTKVLYDRPEASILDFEFQDESLVVLVKEKGRCRLRLLDGDGGLVHELPLGFAAERLHRSCIGGLHVKGEFFAQECYVAVGRVDTLPRYSAFQFDRLVLPCVLSSGDDYYFQRREAHNKLLSYYLLNQYRKQRLLFATIYDELAARTAQSYYNQIMATYNQAAEMNGGFNLVEDGIWSGDLSALADIAYTPDGKAVDALPVIGYYRNVASKPIYCPLLKVRDSLYLFDHVNGRLTVYNSSGKEIRQLPVAHQRAYGWRQLLLVDMIRQKVYAKFTGFTGNLIFREIDLDTGQAGKTYEFDDRIQFHQSVKIRNGYVYHIAHPSAANRFPKVYRQRLY